jgi:predicted site-specific integrase-resolvase
MRFLMMLLGVIEMSERLNIAPGTLYKWRKLGFVPAYRGSRKLLFSEEEVLAAMRKHALDGLSVNLEPGASIR